MKHSSIIDLPRRTDQKDLFGIEKYQDALVEFIKHSNTPLTSALQGEWGSGKTSLMNLLEEI
jgi:predicted KAP-like P-loop ATPase